MAIVWAIENCSLLFTSSRLLRTLSAASWLSVVFAIAAMPASFTFKKVSMSASDILYWFLSIFLVSTGFCPACIAANASCVCSFKNWFVPSVAAWFITVLVDTFFPAALYTGTFISYVAVSRAVCKSFPPFPVSLLEVAASISGWIWVTSVIAVHPSEVNWLACTVTPPEVIDKPTLLVPSKINAPSLSLLYPV